MCILNMRQLRITEVKRFAQLAQSVSGKPVALLRSVCVLSPHSGRSCCLIVVIKLMEPKLVLFKCLLKNIDILKPLPEIVIQNVWGGTQTWAFLKSSQVILINMQREKVIAFHWALRCPSSPSYSSPWQHKPGDRPWYPHFVNHGMGRPWHGELNGLDRAKTGMQVFWLNLECTFEHKTTASPLLTK